MQATRLQMYAAIAAFESDIRQILERYVLLVMSEEEALGDLFEDAERRRREDNDAAASVLEYLDLRPEFDLLNRHREHLPEALSREVRTLTSELDVIVPIRHRVMHIRPLREQDPESLISALNKFTHAQWEALRKTLSQLRTDPLWMPEGLELVPPTERILHNLPFPEYDETGLLGREEELTRVLDLLKRPGRDSVITLTGEGGIGKTALALEAASRVLDDPETPFDMILWVSLKTERLTGTGVRTITDAVHSILGAVDYLGRAVSGSDFRGGVQELADSLDGVNALICVDNLETITGDEFVELYERLPASTKYLVTSRLGIGQLERRIDVGPLSDKAALQLLNQFIRIRDVKALTGISPETRKEIVARFRFSPLAIRWYVLAVEAGRNPLDAIRNQDELIDFCVRSVYEELSEEARILLTALYVLSRPGTADDLVILTELPADLTQRALQELAQGSLVTHSLVGSREMRAIIEPTQAARMFLSRHLSATDPIREQIAKNEARFRGDEERRLADEASRSLAPIVVRVRDDTDRPTAQLLRRALLASQSGDMDTARQLVAEARRLNPEYWEVARVEAFLAANAGQNALARSLYDEAYQLADLEEHRAVVAHFLAGHLARNEREIEAAITFAREAHAIIGTAETQMALGNYLVWNSSFDEGVPLLEATVANSEGKLHVIAATALIDALRRKAEHALTSQNNYLTAYTSAFLGFERGRDTLRAGYVDSKLLNAVLEAANASLRALYVAGNTGDHSLDAEVLFTDLAHEAPRLSRARRIDELRFRLRNLLRVPWLAPKAEELLVRMEDLLGGEGPASRSEEPDGEKSAATSSEWRTAQISRIFGERRYGFLSDKDDGTSLYFRDSAIQEGDFAELFVGDLVWYIPREDSQGRPRVSQLRVTPPGERTALIDQVDSLVESGDWQQATVVSVADKGFLFATLEEVPTLQVFVHATAFESQQEFTLSTAGTTVYVTLSRDYHGRLRALAAKLEN